MPDTLLKVENLSFSYDKETILRDVSFKIDNKEFVAIIGPNGGGKSTLLKLIMGQLEPKSGHITLLTKSPKEAREEVGYVPQNTNVNLEFPIRVLDVVMMGNPKIFCSKLPAWKRLFSIRYSDAEKSCAYKTLQKVGMDSFIYRRIGDLSGGQRQRVMIARALCANPKLLILDEPTSNIDIEGQKQIFALLKELSHEMGILIVSHDISVISYADKVLYLNRSAYYHDLKSSPIHLEEPKKGHFCEVELMQMLSQKSCDCEIHRAKKEGSYE